MDRDSGSVYRIRPTIFFAARPGGHELARHARSQTGNGHAEQPELHTTLREIQAVDRQRKNPLDGALYNEKCIRFQNIENFVAKKLRSNAFMTAPSRYSKVGER